MQTSIEFSEADIQDFSVFIREFVCKRGSCHNDMDLLARRFEVNPQDTYPIGSGSIAARSIEFLRIVNNTPTLLEVINYILEQGFGRATIDIEVCNQILIKYGFSIKEENGQLSLIHVLSSEFHEERKNAESYIKNNANQNVLTHLNDAAVNLSAGRFDYVLDDCRKAMEALTTGVVGFSDSLAELVNNNIILQGNRTRKKDVEFLKAVYGFNSTLGSHSAANRPMPNMEQAILGLYVTESCIVFILKRLEFARDNGITLTRWV
jgi:hypothetical protein